MAQSFKLQSRVFKKTNSTSRSIHTYRILMLIATFGFPVFGHIASFLEKDISINLTHWYLVGFLALLFYGTSFFYSKFYRVLETASFLFFALVSFWILKLTFDYEFRFSFSVGLLVLYFIVVVSTRLTAYLKYYNVAMLICGIITVFYSNQTHINPYVFSFYLILVSLVSYYVLNSRIHIMEELRISESLLFSVFNETEDAIYLVNDQTYEIMDCNRRGFEVFGFSELLDKSELKEKTDFIATQLKPMITNKYDLNPTLSWIEMEIKSSRGVKTLVDLSAKLVNLQNRRLLLVKLTDVSERKRAEKSMQILDEQRVELLNVSKSILSTLSIEKIIEQISISLDQLLDFDGCYIFWIDNHEKKLKPQVLKTSRYVNDTFQNWTMGIDSGITGTVIKTKVAELTNYAHTDPRSVYMSHLQNVYEHLITIPIITKEEVIAVFGVVRNEDPPFTQAEFKLVELFVSLANIAFENANLYQAAQQKIKHNKALVEVTNAINATTDLTMLLDLIVEKVLLLTQTKQGGLFLLDKNKEMLELAASRGIAKNKQNRLKIHVGESIAGWVAKTGQSVLIHNVETDNRYIEFEGFNDLKSIVSVPLIYKGSLIGVLGVDRLRGEESFTADDLQITKDFADQAVLAIENARLFETIKISEEQYRSLFDETEEVVILTSPDGKIMDINQSGVRLFGFNTKEELLSLHSVTELYFNSVDRVDYLESMNKNGHVKNLEVEMRNREGKKITFLETSVVVRNDKGGIDYFRGILRDITEKRKLELQFAQSQKMESIGLLAGGIAHDFNNILSGILGYASLIKTEMNESHQYYKYISSIEVSATRAAELTSQLLAFARGGKYQTKKFDFNETIKETMNIIGRTIDKSIEIELFLSDPLPMIEGDPVQLQQVVLNLCVNARDAISGKGKIIIETNRIVLSEKDPVLKNNLRPGLFIMLSVTDTGSGMDKKTMERVFDPFFTTKEVGKGTGLGLAMVYGVVKNHEGTVNVYSEVGKGTTFRIYLPAEEYDKEFIPKIEPNQGGNMLDLRAKNNEKILVVDDEESLRLLLFDTLTSFGYRVVTASNGLEALDIYNDQHSDISLIVLDIVMPKLDGYETFAELKKINPQVKTVMTSGFSQNMQTQKMLDKGVKDFIQKPFQVKDLLQKIYTTLYT